MLFTVTSQGSQEIIQDFLGIKGCFDLDAHDTGRALMDIATQEILVSIAQEQDPDGIPWPQLSEYYAAWKAGVAPSAGMGVLYGHMVSWEQIAGERLVTSNTAEMTYGIDDVAKAEAIKFTMGGLVTGTNQPQRPFYGLTYMAMFRCDEYLDILFARAW